MNTNNEERSTTSSIPFPAWITRCNEIYDANDSTAMWDFFGELFDLDTLAELDHHIDCAENINACVHAGDSHNDYNTLRFGYIEEVVKRNLNAGVINEETSLRVFTEIIDWLTLFL